MALFRRERQDYKGPIRASGDQGFGAPYRDVYIVTNPVLGVGTANIAYGAFRLPRYNPGGMGPTTPNRRSFAMYEGASATAARKTLPQTLAFKGWETGQFISGPLYDPQSKPSNLVAPRGVAYGSFNLARRQSS